MLLRRYHERGTEGVTTSASMAGSGDGVSPDEHSAEELREMAADLDLPTSGTKAELADRINQRLA